MDRKSPTLAIIGGSGALGQGLAMRWLKAGYPVVVGSRHHGKAEESALLLKQRTGGDVVGKDNLAAAAAGEVVVLTVPFAAHARTLEVIKPEVKGKIVVDTTVPIVPPKIGTVALPEGGSAAQMAQIALGADVSVVSAFHNVAAVKLLRSEPVDCDVLVCGDVKADRDKIIELVRAAGLRGLHAGPLANAAATEAMTSLLIWINKRYRVVDGSGIRITGDLTESDVAGGGVTQVSGKLCVETHRI